MTVKRVLKAVLLGGVLFFFGAGIYGIVNKVKSSVIFTVSAVEVKGVINADRSKLTEVSKKLIGLNIFDHDVEELTTTEDPWVQKLVANRVLPNSVNLVVFEEKPLFYYKSNNKCYIFTASDKNMAASCEGVKIVIEGKFDIGRAKTFVSIAAGNAELAKADVVLKEYNFTAVIEGQTLICPYDMELFDKNYSVYMRSVKQRYKRVEYVDLTIDERIFVKGDQSGSGKG